jgi:hypothetical protein
VSLNGITFIPNFVKFSSVIQNSKGGTRTYRHCDFINLFVSFEASMAVIFQAEIVWDVTPCSSEVHATSISPWRWRQHGPLKRWHPTTTLHGVTTQQISTYKLVCFSCKEGKWDIRNTTSHSHVSPFCPFSTSHTQRVCTAALRCLMSSYTPGESDGFSCIYARFCCSQLYSFRLNVILIQCDMSG